MLVEPIITKKDTNFFAAWERLFITLRFLATGKSQQFVSLAYHLGKSTLSRVIRKNCDVIFEGLVEKYLRSPSATEEWGKTALDFQETWNLTHLVDAIDGKLLRIQCPKQSETLFHNYKKFFRLFLFWAICDAHFSSVYLILVSMVAITMLDYYLTSVLIKDRGGGNKCSSTEVPARLFVQSLALLSCGGWSIFSQNLAYSALH